MRLPRSTVGPRTWSRCCGATLQPRPFRRRSIPPCSWAWPWRLLPMRIPGRLKPSASWSMAWASGCAPMGGRRHPCPRSIGAPCFPLPWSRCRCGNCGGLAMGCTNLRPRPCPPRAGKRHETHAEAAGDRCHAGQLAPHGLLAPFASGRAGGRAHLPRRLRHGPRAAGSAGVLPATVPARDLHDPVRLDRDGVLDGNLWIHRPAHRA